MTENKKKTVKLKRELSSSRVEESFEVEGRFMRLNRIFATSLSVGGSVSSYNHSGPAKARYLHREVPTCCVGESCQQV